ncbi:hypothetical protein OC834_004163 [Tilletia horrida]|nr:hypothetical protein OC834_004163 [Tilletia horrida]
MPAPSISKIALHFSRVAANNAAAGIRSALHAGNSAAASAGINAGGATAAAAAGGAGIGLGAAAASASGASAGASAAGGKTWGAYTYYQSAGQRTLVNLTPGSSDNGTTRTEDDEDEQQALTPAQDALQGANRSKRTPRCSLLGPVTSSTSSSSAPSSSSEQTLVAPLPAVSRHGSIAQVGLRASATPASLHRTVSSSGPSTEPSPVLSVEDSASQSPSLSPAKLALLSQWEQQQPDAAARLQSHAHLRRAYRAVQPTQLIAGSASTDATAGRAAVVPTHLLSSGPAAGPSSLQTASFSTSAVAAEGTSHSDVAHQTRSEDRQPQALQAVELLAAGSRPRAPFNPKRLRSLSFGNHVEFHHSAPDHSDAVSVQAQHDVAAVDLPGMPPAPSKSSQSHRPTRRNSFSNPSSRRNSNGNTADVQPGLRQNTPRGNKRVRHDNDEFVSEAAKLHNELHARLRAYAYWRMPARPGRAPAAYVRQGKRVRAVPPAHLVRAAVHEYLTRIPADAQSVSGWNACLEALFAARLFGSPSAFVAPAPAPKDAATTAEGSDPAAAPAVAAAAQEGGEVAAVEQAEQSSQQQTQAAASSNDQLTLNVLDLYRRMIEAGFQATGRTYSIVIQSLCEHEAELRRHAFAPNHAMQAAQRGSHALDLVKAAAAASCGAAPAAEGVQNSAPEAEAEAEADSTTTTNDAAALAHVTTLLDAMIDRAVELLREAVSAHPRMMTHPISIAPYEALIDTLREKKRPEQIETVLELMKHSVDEANYFKISALPYKRLIQTQTATARDLIRAAESGDPAAINPTETVNLALDGVLRVLSQFEADYAAGYIFDRSNSAAQAEGDQDADEDGASEVGSPDVGLGKRASLDLHNSAIRAAFVLRRPDRALEILERYMERIQSSSDSGSGSASASNAPLIPLHSSTLSTIMRGFVEVDDPMTAVQWLTKVQDLEAVAQQQQADSSAAAAAQKAPSRPVAGRDTMFRLLSALLQYVPQNTRWDPEDEAVKPYLDAISKVIKEFNDHPHLVAQLDSAALAVFTLAHSVMERNGRYAAQQIAKEETLLNKPWQDASVLHPPSPPQTTSDASDESAAAAAATAASSLGDGQPALAAIDNLILTPPTSPAQTAESAPVHDDAVTSASASAQDAVAQPALPAVGMVDVDLGQVIYDKLRPQRIDGHYPVVDVEGAYAIVREKVAVGTYPPPEALGGLMVAFGRDGNLARVNELYAYATTALDSLGGDPEWQARAWHRIEDQCLRALAHAGELTAAIERRHRIIGAGRIPSPDAYASLIAAIKDTTDDALVAEELFDESQRFGVRPNVYLYTTVISKLSRARRTSRALQLFDEMREAGLRPTTVTFGAVINACVRSGDREGALRYFAEMEADRGFRARVPPFNSMIQFFVYTQPDRQQALAFYEKMRGYGVAPSSHTYKLLLDVHGSIEPVQPAEMDKVFAQLQADRRINVLGTHWASLIHCYGTQMKDLNKAIELFQTSTQQSSPDPIAFEALLSVFFELNRSDLIRQYVDSMHTSYPGLRLTAYVCNVLIKGLAQDGGVGLVEARTIFEQMQDPPAGLAATGNHAARSHGAGAVPQVEEAPIHTPAPAAAVATAPLGSFSGATASSFSQVSKEPSTYESMIRAELSLGNVSAAEALLERMEARGFPPALILRTRGLLEMPADRVLRANLVSGAMGGLEMAAAGSEAAA